ncbi:PAS domain S-box protein [Bradyrhizobium sp. HKCCYLR20261]|uniref:PAS domain S-box protein n=1 Tax=Bradyrhizobium sp. HKCCYLR20261 TaxID=3420760 RepID=UPI003EB8CD78
MLVDIDMNVQFQLRSVDVLHVDDDADAREIVGTAIAVDSNFNVRSCASGEEALAATVKWSPDLILLDHNMPGMDGPTTLARLRERPQTAGIPVIYVTGTTSAKELDDLRRVGVAGVIAKPFDPTSLCSQINGILCKSHRELERAKNELEEKAAIADALLDSSEDAIVAKDLSGTILSWNVAAERLFQFRPNEVIGRSIRIHIPPEQLIHDDYILDQVRQGRHIDNLETRRLRKDGTAIDVSIRAIPIRRRDGTIIGASIIERDISRQKRVEDQFRKSNVSLEQEVAARTAELKTLIDAVPSVMAYWDRDLRCRFANSAYAEWFGRSLEELVGCHVTSLLDATLFAEAEPHIQAALSGQPQNYERMLNKADGSIRDTWTNYIPHRDANGDVIGFFVLVTDITEMREAQRMIKESEARYRILADNSSDLIIQLDRDLRLRYVSPACRDILGVDESELLGQQPYGPIHPEDVEQLQTTLNSLLADEAEQSSISIRAHDRNGRRIWLEAVMRSLKDPASGETTGIVGALRDISARKAAEERFRLVVESTPTAMVMVDRSGLISLVNRQTERLFGYDSDELLRRRIDLLLPAAERDRHHAHLEWYFASPVLRESLQRAMGPGREVYGRRKDGSEFPIEISLTPIDTDEGVMVLGAIVDITHRKLAEEERRQFNERLEQEVAQRTAELEAANRELDDFAYAASHDLKAPLRVIDNASKWLEEDLAPHLTGENLVSMQLLRGRVRRLEKLLDDLLEFCRIGREAAGSEIISGAELMDDVLAMMTPPDGFEVIVDPAFGAIEVFRMPLQQIMMNLIGNAIKHHDKAAGRIEISVVDRGSHHTFAVKDDGPGIPAQFHDRIFKMFQTLRPRDQVEGSGMGLAIVRKQIELSGGSILLESTVGEGTTFYFTLLTPNAAKERKR